MNGKAELAARAKVMHSYDDAQVSRLNKGLGSLERAVSAQEIADLGWNLLREDLSLPAAVLYRDRIQHNLDWMKRFINAYGVHLAPHGKTTMAPRLFQLQIDGGAWGITLATAHQAMVAHAHGIRRVLMANQLVGVQNMRIVAQLLSDPEFEFYCLVDSSEGVDQLRRYFEGRQLRLRVLVELGCLGGRCGVRDEDQLGRVLEAIERAHGTIELSGIELYEGVLTEEDQIREFLRHARNVAERLQAQGRFAGRRALISGAGSAWYDLVAEEFSALGQSMDIVLRPGCYLTHDVGSYEVQQQRILKSNPVAQTLKSGLIPALHIWAYVQSVPEPNLAVVTMGKRDAAFDSGLPAPALRYRPGDPKPRKSPAHWQTTRLMDQHGFLRISAGDDLRVGDMVGFNISHPCLTFDKWRVLAIVNEDYDVVDVVKTYF